jgi:uncharacterized protein YndB with AHSA1/START domain
MGPMTTTIEIARPPAEVFAYLTDPTRFAEWQADVVRVEMTGSPAATGARFVTVRRIAGAEQSMTQQVVACDPPRHWASVATAGPIRPAAGIEVAGIDGGDASRVTFTLSFEARGIGVALLPLVRRQAARLAPVSYRRVKQRLERDTR